MSGGGEGTPGAPEPALAHLDPLRLRNEQGGIVMRGTQPAAEPRVRLVGYGPSQQPVGANRAARDAVADGTRRLDREDARVEAA